MRGISISYVEISRRQINNLIFLSLTEFSKSALQFQLQLFTEAEGRLSKEQEQESLPKFPGTKETLSLFLPSKALLHTYANVTNQTNNPRYAIFTGRGGELQILTTPRKKKKHGKKQQAEATRERANGNSALTFNG